MRLRAKTNSRNGDTELSAGIASLRADVANLLLRMEEGELQKDHFVREVGKFTYEKSMRVAIPRLSLFHHGAYRVPSSGVRTRQVRICHKPFRAREGSRRDAVVSLL